MKTGVGPGSSISSKNQKYGFKRGLSCLEKQTNKMNIYKARGRVGKKRKIHVFLGI